MRKRDFGKLFFQRLSLDTTAPHYSVAPSFEITYPFRASRSVMLRLFRDHGLIIGWWEDNQFGTPEDDDAMDRYLVHALGSAKGPDTFVTASRESQVIQQARVALGEIDIQEPPQGYLGEDL
jgi:hypothetical protein